MQTDWHKTADCAVLPHITSNTPGSKLDITTWNIPKDIKLADPHFNQPGAIDMLIGADLFYELFLPNRKTKPGHPVLQETVLGWIVSGRTPAVNNSSAKQHTFLLRENGRLEHSLNRFREVESVEPSTMPPEQQACEQHFITHTLQRRNGRFGVRLPLKAQPNQLGTSHRSAERRQKQSEHKVHYNFMKKHEELAHREPVNSRRGRKTSYCLHHPVLKETSSTTRTRIVYNAGAKLSNGPQRHNMEFLNSIPQELRESQPTLSIDNMDGFSNLRLLWHPTSDRLQDKSNSSSTSTGTQQSINAKCWQG
jgi:hypothetical protein